MKIYVPNLNNYSCVVVRNDTTIRAYETTPTYNSNIPYRDYYVNSHYIFTDGVQNFSNYTTLPTCLNSDNLTDTWYYRNDLVDIAVVLFIALFIFWFVLLKFLHKLIPSL